MSVYRLIAPDWLVEEGAKKVHEGEFTPEQLAEFNEAGYNIYFLPNYPSQYTGGTVDGSHIDRFEWVFVDMDLKDGRYADKEEFLAVLADFPLKPSRIVDSGNGIHAYWRVKDLDAMSYLRLQRRLCRKFETDEAVGKLFQLMRLPNTVNTKDKNEFKLCEEIASNDAVYTAERLDSVLPSIGRDDESVCQAHYQKTYQLQGRQEYSDDLPPKFAALLRSNKEVKSIWVGEGDGDRSRADYRLGHIMFASGFTRDEAMSVLVNSAKAMTRAPVHRGNYASNIVDKIWTFENTKSPTKAGLSQSVADLLVRKDDESLKGRRFPAQPYFDGTEHGFRLTQVIGLCAGVGVGKTAIGLNLFKGMVERNPDYIHMFVSLEQPAREIAGRWLKMCGGNTALHSKVHVLSNYNDDGSYRHLSLDEIKEYILQFQRDTGLKVGCVCLDHIGVLRQESAAGEYQGLRDICSQLKAFAIATETLFVIQTQTNRDKAGIGDLELFKDAAFGTQSFESFLDFLLCCWQPLKRCYQDEACPRVTAFKFAKIRFKSKKDSVTEDQCYRLFFEQETETLRPLTQDEEISFDFYAKQALNKRKRDRKTDLVEYTSITWTQEETDGKTLSD